MRAAIEEFLRIIGILMFWSGLLLLLYHIPLAVSLMLSSLFVMPNVFYAVFGAHAPWKQGVRALLAAALLVLPLYGWYRSLAGDPLVDTHAKATAEYAAQQKEKAMQRFHDNRETIMKGIRRYYEAGNYRFAYAHAEEFLYSGDPELLDLHEKSKQMMIKRGEFKDASAGSSVGADEN